MQYADGSGYDSAVALLNPMAFFYFWQRHTDSVAGHNLYFEVYLNTGIPLTDGQYMYRKGIILSY